MGALADFCTDVNDVRFKQAEELVYAAMQRIQSWQVRDLRQAHRSYDFEVCIGRQWWGVDVKYDRYIERSGNVVFECFHQHDDGYRRRGWGYSDRLHYIAVVGESLQQADLFSVPHFRSLVETAEADGTAGRWKRTQPRNTDGYQTFGYAVPRQELIDAGVYRMHLPLTTNPWATLRQDW